MNPSTLCVKHGFCINHCTTGWLNKDWEKMQGVKISPGNESDEEPLPHLASSKWRKRGFCQWWVSLQMQGESEGVMHFTAMQLHAALHGSKENQQGIVVPMIARRRKMHPVCQPALTAFETNIKIPSGFHGSREIPWDLGFPLGKGEMWIFRRGSWRRMQFFHWNFQWDPVSSQSWVLPGGHHPLGIKPRSRLESSCPQSWLQFIPSLHYKFGVFQNAGQIFMFFFPPNTSLC